MHIDGSLLELLEDILGEEPPEKLIHSITDALDQLISDYPDAGYEDISQLEQLEHAIYPLKSKHLAALALKIASDVYYLEYKHHKQTMQNQVLEAVGFAKAVHRTELEAQARIENKRNRTSRARKKAAASKYQLHREFIDQHAHLPVETIIAKLDIYIQREGLTELADKGMKRFVNKHLKDAGAK